MYALYLLNTHVPSNLNKGLIVLLGRVLHQVIVQFDCVLGIHCNHRTATVLKCSEALPSMDLDTFFDPVVVFDATHEHSTDRYYCETNARRAFHYHDRTAILAKDIERAWFIDSLWVDRVVAEKLVSDSSIKARVN